MNNKKAFNRLKRKTNKRKINKNSHKKNPLRRYKRRIKLKKKNNNVDYFKKSKNNLKLFKRKLNSRQNFKIFSKQLKSINLKKNKKFHPKVHIYQQIIIKYLEKEIFLNFKL
jgi:hypothetical protein